MWYVIQTQTGREQELTECIERVLKGNGYQACFVIEQECVWRNAGELLEYQKPLFPSYVIADTDTPEHGSVTQRGMTVTANANTGGILSGVKAGPEALQTPADGL